MTVDFTGTWGPGSDGSARNYGNQLHDIHEAVILGRDFAEFNNGVPKTYLVKTLATVNATLAAQIATAEAFKTAIDGLVSLVQSGGGNIDLAAIAEVKAAVLAVGADANAQFQAMHDESAAMRAENVDLKARLAAALGSDAT